MTRIVSLRFAGITVCLMSIVSIPGMAIAQTRTAVSAPATSVERSSPIAGSDEARVALDISSVHSSAGAWTAQHLLAQSRPAHGAGHRGPFGR